MNQTLRRSLSAATLLVVAFLLAAPFGGPVGLTVVQGESMLPTHEHGDLVLTWAVTEPSPGDVVVFDIGRADVIHRVVEQAPDGGWITWGDNNAVPDPWHTPVEDMRGRVVVAVPAVGGLLIAMQDGLGTFAPWLVMAWALFLLARTVGPLADDNHHDPLLDLLAPLQRRLSRQAVASDA